MLRINLQPLLVENNGFLRLTVKPTHKQVSSIVKHINSSFIVLCCLQHDRFELEVVVVMLTFIECDELFYLN